MARRVAAGASEVHTAMRRSHLLTDDCGYLYARYVRGRYGAISTVVRMRRRRLVRALSTSTVVLSALLAGCSTPPGRRSPLCNRLRGRPPGQAHRREEGGRPARDRGTQERPVLAQLHIAGIQRFRRPAAPRRHVGLRDLRRRPRLDQRRHRIGEHRCGARPFRADPRGRGPAGDDDRFGPAVVGAAAGLAVARRRRRAQGTSDRGPSTGAAWECRARSTVATCSTVRKCSTRPSSSPATTRSPTSARSPWRPPPAAPTPSRPATRPTTIHTPPRTSSGCAAPGWPHHRAAGHRQRSTSGAGLCRLASRQGGTAGARLAVAARHRRRGRHRTARQG